MNHTPFKQFPDWWPPAMGAACFDDTTLPVTPEKFCTTNRYSTAPISWDFFRTSTTSSDQLRLRMAHVWHQIFVVSAPIETYAMAEFQQRLRSNAFATFERLLLQYSLSPQLGRYQSWVRNVPEKDGIKPNENFARELMQLFTIGVNELNDDGTPKVDAGKQFIPTYGQPDIEALARILTGFTYPTPPGDQPAFFGNWYFRGDMIAFDEWHDKGAKTMLHGRLVLPPGGDASSEVRAAIRMLVNHPNTAPFISRQLIQKTVTSSPTPGFVARVASVFKDNGAGTRGDLAAVTRAIFLDPEARGARKIDTEYGRLREPALLWTAMLRALDVQTDGVNPSAAGIQSGQYLFAPPTVFNYYPSDYTIAGSDIPGPEFGIYGSAEFLNRANQINDLLHNADQSWSSHPVFGWGPRPYVPDAIGTRSPSLAAYLPSAGDPNGLVERLNRLFLHGRMSPTMRKTIVNAVGKIPPSDSLRRVKMAVNLILASVAYQVQK